MHIRILLLPQDSYIRSNNHRTAQRCLSALRSSIAEGHRDAEPYTPLIAASPVCCFSCPPGDSRSRATTLRVYLSYAHLLIVGDVTIKTADIQGGARIVIGLLSITEDKIICFRLGDFFQELKFCLLLHSDNCSKISCLHTNIAFPCMRTTHRNQ